jgi:transcriptional regulator with XRE-family HTH domain
VLFRACDVRLLCERSPMPRRTEVPFREELPRLLAGERMSLRELSRRIGINQSYLTSVLQGRRAPSRRLLEGAASALELPHDYFREYREAVVVERVRADPQLRERVYALLGRSSR